MTDFVLSESQCAPISAIQFADRLCNYANFLKQPLTLSMFVPCRSDGKPLEKPIEPEAPYNDKQCDIWQQYEFYKNRYYEAKEAVLFEGFSEVKVEGGVSYCSDNLQVFVINNKLHFDEIFEDKLPRYIGRLIDIEDLVRLDLTLTPTALKTIYG